MPPFRCRSLLAPPAMLALALGALAVGAAGCGRAKVTPTECGEMLDRYLDMTIAGDPALAALPPAQGKVARDMKREVKKADASYRQVEERCEREVSRGEYNCAMKAKVPNEWEACIE